MADWKVINKWGYLNKPGWTVPPGAPVNYSGNESNEPQVWPLINQHDHKYAVTTGHLPCGHWHVTGGHAAPATDPPGDAPRDGDTGEVSCLNLIQIQMQQYYGTLYVDLWGKPSTSPGWKRCVRVSDGHVVDGPTHYSVEDRYLRFVFVGEYDTEYQVQFAEGEYGVWSSQGCIFSISEDD